MKLVLIGYTLAEVETQVYSMGFAFDKSSKDTLIFSSDVNVAYTKVAKTFAGVTSCDKVTETVIMIVK